jgi:hypothetical protein
MTSALSHLQRRGEKRREGWQAIGKEMTGKVAYLLYLI